MCWRVRRRCKKFLFPVSFSLPLTAMSMGSNSNMIKQIDQLSVSIIIDQTVQDNLKGINQRYGKHGSNNNGVSTRYK